MKPEDFFSPWEHVIDDWSKWESEVANVLGLSPNRKFAWRGVANSAHSLHSSVYRRLVRGSNNPPDEDEITKFERAVLEVARTRWRFDNLSAMEIFAHIQHYGGPTRLLDVSLNPLVALWFAVEQKYGSDGELREDGDGRIFIFDVTRRQVSLDERWAGRDLPWDPYPSDNWRRGLPLLWRPPSYNERIPAQNSAFLLGGIP